MPINSRYLGGPYTTSSSLYKASLSAQKKVKNIEDTQTRYLWDNNQMSNDDYYSYVQKRLKEAQDSGDQLEEISWLRTSNTVEKKYRSDYRASEFLRISQVMDDNSGTTLDKANVYYNLAQMALEDGDMDAYISYMTSANNTYDSYLNKVSSENKSAAAAYEKAAKKAAVLKIKEADTELNRIKTDNSFDTNPSAKIAATGQASFLKALAAMEASDVYASFDDIAQSETYLNTARSAMDSFNDAGKKIQFEYEKDANGNDLMVDIGGVLFKSPKMETNSSGISVPVYKKSQNILFGEQPKLAKGYAYQMNDETGQLDIYNIKSKNKLVKNSTTGEYVEQNENVAQMASGGIVPKLMVGTYGTDAELLYKMVIPVPDVNGNPTGQTKEIFLKQQMLSEKDSMGNPIYGNLVGADQGSIVTLNNMEKTTRNNEVRRILAKYGVIAPEKAVKTTFVKDGKLLDTPEVSLNIDESKLSPEAKAELQRFKKVGSYGESAKNAIFNKNIPASEYTRDVGAKLRLDVMPRAQQEITKLRQNPTQYVSNVNRQSKELVGTLNRNLEKTKIGSVPYGQVAKTISNYNPVNVARNVVTTAAKKYVAPIIKSITNYFKPTAQTVTPTAGQMGEYLGRGGGYAYFKKTKGVNSYDYFKTVPGSKKYVKTTNTEARKYTGKA